LKWGGQKKFGGGKEKRRGVKEKKFVSTLTGDYLHNIKGGVMGLDEKQTGYVAHSMGEDKEKTRRHPQILLQHIKRKKLEGLR